MPEQPDYLDPQSTPQAQQPPKQNDQISLEDFEEMARQKYGVPKNLVKAMTQQESGGQPDNGWGAKSPTGVKGKYQVTEATAKQYGLDRNDPFQQTVAAMKHLRAQYDALGDIKDNNARWLSAVGRYYGGSNAVDPQGRISTDSPDGVSNPLTHMKRVADNWKQLGLDGNGDGVPDSQQTSQAPAPQAKKVKPSPKPQPAPDLIQQATGGNVASNLISSAIKNNPLGNTLYSAPAGPVVNNQPIPQITPKQQAQATQEWENSRNQVKPLTREELRQVRAQKAAEQVKRQAMSDALPSTPLNPLGSLPVSAAIPFAQTTAANVVPAVANVLKAAGAGIPDSAVNPVAQGLRVLGSAGNAIGNDYQGRAANIQEARESLPDDPLNKAVQVGGEMAGTVVPFGVAEMAGGPVTAHALNVASQDWSNPKQAIRNAAVNSALMATGSAAGKVSGDIGQQVANRTGSDFLGTAANVAGRTGANALLAPALTGAANVLEGKPNTADELTHQALMGAAFANLSNPSIRAQRARVGYVKDAQGNITDVVPIDVAKAAQADQMNRANAQEQSMLSELEARQPQQAPASPAAPQTQPAAPASDNPLTNARQRRSKLAQAVAPQEGAGTLEQMVNARQGQPAQEATPSASVEQSAKAGKGVEIFDPTAEVGWEDGTKIRTHNVDGKDIIIRFPKGMDVTTAKILAEQQVRKGAQNGQTSPEPIQNEARTPEVTPAPETNAPVTQTTEQLPVRSAEPPVESARGNLAESQTVPNEAERVAASSETSPATSPATPKGRIVNVNGKDFTLTPEQEALWQKEVLPREQRIANLREHPHDDYQYQQKLLKGAGMELSAIKRKIVGNYTDTELANQAKREASNYNGKPVSVEVNGETFNGTVKGRSFGKIRVTLEDGQTISVDPDKVGAPVVKPKQEVSNASEQSGTLAETPSANSETRTAAPVETGAKGSVETRPAEETRSDVSRDSDISADESRPSSVYSRHGIELAPEVADAIDKRHAARESEDKGNLGKLGEFSRKALFRTGEENPDAAFAAHPVLRKLLGLPEIPQDLYERSPKDWATMAQHTMDALAHEVGAPRSSRIDEATLNKVGELLGSRLNPRNPEHRNLVDVYGQTRAAVDIAHGRVDDLFADNRVRSAIEAAQAHVDSGKPLRGAVRTELKNALIEAQDRINKSQPGIQGQSQADVTELTNHAISEFITDLSTGRLGGDPKGWLAKQFRDNYAKSDTGAAREPVRPAGVGSPRETEASEPRPAPRSRRTPVAERTASEESGSRDASVTTSATDRGNNAERTGQERGVASEKQSADRTTANQERQDNVVEKPAEYPAKEPAYGSSEYESLKQEREQIEKRVAEIDKSLSAKKIAAGRRDALGRERDAALLRRREIENSLYRSALEKAANSDDPLRAQAARDVLEGNNSPDTYNKARDIIAEEARKQGLDDNAAQSIGADLAGRLTQQPASDFSADWRKSLKNEVALYNEHAQARAAEESEAKSFDSFIAKEFPRVKDKERANILAKYSGDKVIEEARKLHDSRDPDLHRERTENLTSLDDVSVKPSQGWHGSVTSEQGDLIADGYVLVKRDAVRNKALFDKPADRQVAKSDQLAQVWDNATKDLENKADADIVGVKDYDKQERKDGGIPTAYLLERGGDRVISVNSDKLALLKKQTNFDGIKVKDAKSPVVLTKNGEPVAVVMPLRDENPQINVAAARERISGEPTPRGGITFGKQKGEPESGGTTLGSNLGNAFDKFNRADIGKILDHLKTHGENFVGWAKAMIKDFGEQIRPKLRSIYNQGKAFLADQRGSNTVDGGKLPSQEELTNQAKGKKNHEKIGLPADFDIRKYAKDADKILADSNIPEEKLNKVKEIFQRSLEAVDNGDGAALAKTQIEMKDLLKNTTWVKAADFMRPLNATGEFSPVGRQGWIGWLTHPKSSLDAFLAATGRDEGAMRFLAEQLAKPNMPLMKEAGLDLGMLNEINLSKSALSREENTTSRWPEKIPLAGRAFGYIERFNKTFLEGQRINLFEGYQRAAEARGAQMWETGKDGKMVPSKAAKEIAKQVNIITGRGNIPDNKVAQAIVDLGSVVAYSPRFAISRFQAADPTRLYRVWKQSPEVAKSVIADYTKQLAACTALAGMLKVAGFSVNVTDPDDPDFLKAKIGNFRVPIVQGGLQPAVRFAAKMVKRGYEMVSGTGEKGRGGSVGKMGDDIKSFARQKEAPMAGFLHDQMLARKDYTDAVTQEKVNMGTNAIGQPVSAGRDFFQHMLPMYFLQTIESYQNGGPAVGAATGGLELFGLSSGYYDSGKYGENQSEGLGKTKLKRDWSYAQSGYLPWNEGMEPLDRYHTRVQRADNLYNEQLPALRATSYYQNANKETQRKMEETLNKRIQDLSYDENPNKSKLAPTAIVGSIKSGERRSETQRKKNLRKAF